MYYQPDLSYSQRIFKMLLIVSIAIHGAILFYKKSGNALILNAPEFLNTTSIQVQLRDTPQEIVRPKPIVKKKIIKKKVVKKVARKAAPKPQEIKEEVQASSAPQRKPFKSFIDNFVHPHYPRLAKRRGITGRVELLLTVKGNGQLKDVIIAKSSGHSILDNSALEAAKRWTFKQISSNLEQVFQLSKAVVYKFN